MIVLYLLALIAAALWFAFSVASAGALMIVLASITLGVVLVCGFGLMPIVRYPLRAKTIVTSDREIVVCLVKRFTSGTYSGDRLDVARVRLDAEDYDDQLATAVVAAAARAAVILATDRQLRRIGR